MFTGIVREVGEVVAVAAEGDTRVEIACTRPEADIEIGASIACSGVCLTVVAKGTRNGRSWFAINASAETRALSTLKHWAVGTKVNLEPSLRVGDELGGHIVSGHVDGLGRITGIRPEGGSHRVDILAPAALGPFLARKGSVAVDGISLTINAVEDTAEGTIFGINVIPHTWSVTNLADAGEGSEVNLEIDLLARYAARLAEASRQDA
ncbi:MAG: riboflavin synthase [Pseudomonadota bacterium]